MTWMLVVIAALAMLAYLFRDVPIETIAPRMKIIEGVAVVGALLVAGAEYFSHLRADEAKKHEATALMARAFDPKSVNDALFYLKHEYVTETAKEVSDEKRRYAFDKATWPLIPYFSVAEFCATHDVCNFNDIKAIYCQTFKTYSDAYYAIHTEVKRGNHDLNDYLGWMKTLNSCQDI